MSLTNNLWRTVHVRLIHNGHSTESLFISTNFRTGSTLLKRMQMMMQSRRERETEENESPLVFCFSFMHSSVFDKRASTLPSGSGTDVIITLNWEINKAKTEIKAIHISHVNHPGRKLTFICTRIVINFGMNAKQSVCFRVTWGRARGFEDVGSDINMRSYSRESDEEKECWILFVCNNFVNNTCNSNLFDPITCTAVKKFDH